MLLAVTNDLMAAAPIENAARQWGYACRVVGSSQLENLTLDASPALVLLDLTAASDVAAVVAAIRHTVGDTVPIVAFGPHVQEAKLQAATEAGCTQVLTRGQFHRDMGRIISQFALPGPHPG